MIVAASAQAAEPPANLSGWLSTSGTTKGTLPFSVLVRGHVAQPLREEAGHVHVEARGAREGLGIPGPAQPLVPLRAVGGHVEEVALLSPEDVVLELVQQRVRRGELPGHRHVGVDDDAVRPSSVGSPGQPSTAT